MATVEINTGTHVKRYDFWNPATWAIPKLYWDAYSQEQRIHAICRQLEKVIRYADYVGVNVDDIAQRLQDIEDGKLDDIIVAAVEAWFEEHAEDITQRITALEGVLPIGEFSDENTVKDAIDAVINMFADYSTTAEIETAINEAKNELNADISVLENFAAYPDHLYGARPIIRDEYDETQYIPQGCCVYPTEEQSYIAVYLQRTGASADGLLRIYRKEDRMRVNELAVSYGHGSTIDYDDETEKMYVLGFNENYYVYELNASNVIAPSLERAYDFSNLNMIPVCYYKDRKYLAFSNWTSKTRSVYTVDLDTMQPEFLCIVPVAYENWPGLLQSVSYDKTRDIIVLASANTGSKAIFFKPDGTLVKTMGFEPQYSFIHLYEMQEVSTIGNAIYFMNCMQGNEGAGKYTHVLTVFEGDLSDPSKNALDGITPLGNWVLVNLSENNDPYNEYDDGNNYIGSSVAPVKIRYSADLQAVFDVFDNSAVHISLSEDYTNEIITLTANGNAVTIDGNNHQIAGIFADNGQFTLRTMGANTNNYANWLTQQRGGLPCLVIATNSDVILQNIFSGTAYYACSAQCSKVFCRDSGTVARIHNAGASYAVAGVLA